MKTFFGSKNVYSSLSLRFLSIASCLWLSQQAFASAAAGFARSYRAPAGVPAWNEGHVGVLPGGPQYSLTTFGLAPTNQSSGGSVSVARLDSAGNIEWALWSVEGTMGYTTLKARPTEPLVYAKIEGLAQEEFWTVFGLFNARDGSRVFERGIPVAVDQLGTTNSPEYFPVPSSSADFLSDGRSFVIIDPDDSVVRVAVLDQLGQPQWQRAFSAGSFATSAGGLRSTLIEYPGQGFWLLVESSQPISTQPNPPATNNAATLNLLRLDNNGQLLWATNITGLQTSGPPALGATTIGADGSLVLTFTDVVLSPPVLNPTLNDFITYILVLNPDGQLRWARRIRSAAGTGLVPVLSPDGTALFLTGTKLRSLQPLTGDGVILKLDAATGASLGQVAIRPGAIQDLAIAAIVNDRLLLHARSFSLTAPGNPYVGSLDLNLQNPIWKQFSFAQTFSYAGLLYEPTSGSLVFWDAPNGDSRMDAIQLGLDLNPLVGGALASNSTCQFFTDAPLTLSNPNITLETVNLTQSQLRVSVSDTELPLIPTTRIQLGSMSPVVQDLCNADPASEPAPSLRVQVGTGQVQVAFPSQAGIQYELLFTPALSQPFALLEQISGTGTMIERNYVPTAGGKGFYGLRILP
jgi:hypothetical protein